MADAPPAPTGLVAPEPDISIAGRFLGVSIFLYLAALCSVARQFYIVFYKKTRINIADFLVLAALVCLLQRVDSGF